MASALKAPDTKNLPGEDPNNAVAAVAGDRGKPKAPPSAEDLRDQVNIEKGKNEGAAEEKKKPSLNITIKLDLDVEVHLTARIKGDIEIGLL